MRDSFLPTVFIVAVAAALPGIADAAGHIEEASGDACKLLTAAQASSVLGVPVDEGAYMMPGHTQFCVWNEQDKTEMSAQNIRIILLTTHQYDGAKAGPFAKGSEAGVGDDAYWSYTPGVGYALSIKKGTSYIRIESRPIPKGATRKPDTPADKEKWEEKEKTVAKAVASESLKKL